MRKKAKFGQLWEITVSNIVGFAPKLPKIVFVDPPANTVFRTECITGMQHDGDETLPFAVVG